MASLMALALFAACAPARAAEGGGSPDAAEAASLTLAEVDGEPITLADLRVSFGTRHSGHGGMLIGEEILRTVLDKAIAERLMIREGYRMGLAEDARFKAAVEAKSDLVRLEALERRFIQEAAAPSEEEVKAAYGLLPRQVRLSLLDCRDERTAGEALGRIRIGEPFADVARQISVHPSRAQGGDMGWVTWGLLDEPTERILFAAERGELKGPFAVGGEEVFRILRIEDEKTGEPPALEEARRTIEAILTRRNRVRLRQELLESIRKASPPEENAEAIRKLLGGGTPAGGESPDPPDDAVIMKTATGLELTAGRVRAKALRSNQPVEKVWRASSEDALLIDEARRRIPLEGAVELDVQVYADGLIRNEVERAAILNELKMEEAVAQAQAYYESHPEEFRKPASYQMRQIVSATREEAEDVRKALLAGGDFAALAKERSIDASSSGKGGDLGWSEAPPEGAPEAIAALEPGGFTEVLETPLGFAIVQLVTLRQAEVAPFEKVRDQAAKRYMVRKQRDLREAFVARLREVSKVKLFEKAFARAVEIQDAAARARLHLPNVGEEHGD